MAALLHLTALGVFWFLASINPDSLVHSGFPTPELGLKSHLPVLQGALVFPWSFLSHQQARL